MMAGSFTTLLWAAGLLLVILVALACWRKTRHSALGTRHSDEIPHTASAEARVSSAEASSPESPVPSARTDPFSQLEFDGWQRVAGRYQDTWADLTIQFVPALLDAIEIHPGDRLLDVCCGPGLISEAAQQRGATAIGIDFSPDMLLIARGRCPEIEFRQGDAQALPFEPASFDLVVMNFGLLHLAEPERAFAEAARVLRPGGRYAFTAWAGPEDSPGAKIVQDALDAHADLNVGVPVGPDHLPRGRRDEWAPLLAAAGFDSASVTVRLARGEWDVPTDFFLFEAERHAGVRTAALLAAQTPEALARIERRMIEGVRPFAKDDAYAIPYAAWIIGAVKDRRLGC
jgi:SAM-dependent methyltransferase